MEYFKSMFYDLQPNLYSAWFAAATVSLVLWLAYTIVLPPSNFPKNIPTIPFYVSFLGSYTDLDQEQIFNKYLREKLEKFGAVKLYFASRWNILVTKPSYLAQIFKEEDIFAKSGNQKKIPYSVLSAYTGENVISAHGDTWKRYRDVMTPGIQFPDYSPVIQNTHKFINELSLHTLKGDYCVCIMDVVQKWSLANIGQSMLGLDLKTLDNDELGIHEKLKDVKKQIFKPFFLNFPFFDILPIPSRMKAQRSVSGFRQLLSNLVKNSNTTSLKANSAGSMLTRALETGRFTSKEFTDNVMIIMIAGHENPQLLLSSLVYILSKHREVQQKLRLLVDIDDLSHSLDNPTLNAIVYETLRMFPPLGQIINRCTTKSVILGKDISIPKGAYVGYNNFGTGRDRNFWGKDADKFQPERWGASTKEINQRYAKAKSSCILPAFHGRKRACLGEKFALFEIKVALIALVSSFKFSLDPNWKQKLTPAGPISPLMLRIKLEPLDRKKKKGTNSH